MECLPDLPQSASVSEDYMAMLSFNQSSASDNLLPGPSTEMDASSLILNDGLEFSSLCDETILESLSEASFTGNSRGGQYGESIGRLPPLTDGPSQTSTLHSGGIDEHYSTSLLPPTSPEPLDLQSWLDSTPPSMPAFGSDTVNSLNSLSSSSWVFSSDALSAQPRHAIDRLVPLFKCPFEDCTTSFVEDKKLQ